MDATHVASVFEFSEHEGENGCTPQVQPTIFSSSQHIGSNKHDSNQTSTSTRQYHLWTDCLQMPNDVLIHIEKEKNIVPIYVVTGKHRTLTLESVRKVLAQCQCQRRCLENIHDLDILGLRYKAWDSKSYSERGTWIRGILEAAKVLVRN